MKLWVLSIFALTVFGSTAHSEFLYQFDVNSVDAIRPFSFSLTSPTLIGEGASLNFAPISITNETDTWTVVQGSADEPCFDFGTAEAILATCGSNIPGLPLAGAFYVDMTSGALPTSTGTFSFSGQVTLITSTNGLLVGPFTGNLAVSSSPTVPEPGSMSSLGVALVAMFGRCYLRKSNHRRDLHLEPSND